MERFTNLRTTLKIRVVRIHTISFGLHWMLG